ncbi:hypothetical protein Ndes2526B_g08310 [Nannochloris sp. 'desiccata']|nr:hypothetical protein KSW81_001776 [Chlorella desiccata (nom. nud.)]KAH7616209.1 putative G-patch domain-containing protein 1 [Chlorella desiccata (nom. nud.)]
MKLPDGYVAGQGVQKPTGYGGFGERMLRTMGWDKGQGLGKEQQGMKEAIEVKKKEDTVGVGSVARWNWDDKWWERAFDSAAQTVDKDSSDSSDSDSDDEIDAARIAAAINGGGTPAASTSGGAVNRDGTATTASRDELKLLNALTSQKSRLAAGRFGGRDAKMERIRTQEAKMAAEAAAKLGVLSTVTTTVTKDERGTVSNRSDTTSEAAATLSKVVKQKKKDKKMKKKKIKEEKSSSKKLRSKPKESSSSDDDDKPESSPLPPVKKQRIIIEPQGLYTTDGPTTWNFTPTPKEGWWGATMFTSAGCLDGMKKDIKATKRAEFTEDQQETLYHAAHAGKTQGKVGLGQRSGPVKIGGVKWSGKKVAFEEEGSEKEATSSGGEEENERKKKKKAELKAVGSSTGLAKLETSSRKKSKKKDKKKSTIETDTTIAGSERGVSAEWVTNIKWKKVLTKTLEAAPGGELKLKALHSAVTATVVKGLGRNGSSSMGVVSTEHVQVQVENTIAASSKFVLEGKKVKLVSAATGAKR